MCCIEQQLNIYTKWNGCVLSDTAWNNSAAKEGKAIWREHRAGGDKRAGRQRSMQLHEGITKASNSGDPVWMRAERKWKSLSQRNKQGGKQEDKTSESQELRWREMQVRKETWVHEAGWMTAHTEKRPVTDWSVTVGISSTPVVRKEYPESTSLFH